MHLIGIFLRIIYEDVVEIHIISEGRKSRVCRSSGLGTKRRSTREHGLQGLDRIDYRQPHCLGL